MKRTFPLFATSWIWAANFFIWCGCTKSPFGETEISGGARQIRGEIELEQGRSRKDVFVWLEGANIGTRTDQDGRFVLTLPPATDQNQNTGNGITGVFNLYFYLANFAPVTTPITLRNGTFVYGQGEIDKNGDLRQAKIMTEILRITTVITPPVVARTYRDTILAAVKLWSISDPVTVVFPKSFVDNIGALFFRNIDTGQVHVVQLYPGITFDHTETIGRAIRTASAVFDLIYSPIPPGKYEVIPYLLVKNNAVPNTLVASLGSKVEELSADYLNIPFRREGGSFEVK